MAPPKPPKPVGPYGELVVAPLPPMASLPVNVELFTVTVNPRLQP